MANKYEKLPLPKEQLSDSQIKTKVGKWPTNITVEEELAAGRKRRQQFEKQAYAKDQAIKTPADLPIPSATEIKNELSAGKKRRQQLREPAKNAPHYAPKEYQDQILSEQEKTLLINDLLAKENQFDETEIARIKAENINETILAGLINQRDQNINPEISLKKIEQVTGRLFPNNNPDVLLSRYENFKHNLAENLLNRLGIIGPNNAPKRGGLDAKIIDNLAILYHLDPETSDQKVIDIAKKDVFREIEAKQQQRQNETAAEQRQITEELAAGKKRRQRHSNLSAIEDTSLAKQSAGEELIAEQFSEKLLSNNQTTLEYRHQVKQKETVGSTINDLLAKNSQFSPEDLNVINEQNIRENLISQLISRCNNNNRVRISLLKLEQLTGNLFPTNNLTSLRKRYKNFRQEFAESLLAKIGILGQQDDIPNQPVSTAVVDNLRLIYDLNDKLSDRQVVETARTNIFGNATIDEQIQIPEEVSNYVNQWREYNTDERDETEYPTWKNEPIEDQENPDLRQLTDNGYYPKSLVGKTLPEKIDWRQEKLLKHLSDADSTIEKITNQINETANTNPHDLPRIINQLPKTLNQGIALLSEQINDYARKIAAEKNVADFAKKEYSQAEKNLKSAQQEYLRHKIPFYKIFARHQAAKKLEKYIQEYRDADDLYSKVKQNNVARIAQYEPVKDRLTQARAQYQKIQNHLKNINERQYDSKKDRAKQSNKILIKIAEDPLLEEPAAELINLVEKIFVEHPENLEN